MGRRKGNVPSREGEEAASGLRHRPNVGSAPQYSRPEVGRAAGRPAEEPKLGPERMRIWRARCRRQLGRVAPRPKCARRERIPLEIGRRRRAKEEEEEGEQRVAGADCERR